MAEQWRHEVADVAGCGRRARDAAGDDRAGGTSGPEHYTYRAEECGFMVRGAMLRAAVDELFAEEGLRRLATSLRSREDDAPVRVMDAAYWRKGCSSLGRLRLAVLVAIGKGREERHCLMDVKEAIVAAAPRSTKAAMPRGNAECVVSGARNLSPFLGSRMVSTQLLDKTVFIRELLPQDLKLEIEHLSRDEAMGVAAFLAQVVGRAHGRQLNASNRKRWLGELQRDRSRLLDAPFLVMEQCG